MRLNRGWRNIRRRLAAVGILVRRKPRRVRFDLEVLVNACCRQYDSLYVSRRRILVANILSGLLIAFSVYFLSRTAFFERIVDAGIRALIVLKFFIFKSRLLPAPLFPAFFWLLLVVSLAAWFCTYVTSLRTAVMLNFGLAGGVVFLNLYAPPPFTLPLSAAMVVVCITCGVLLDHYLNLRFLRRRSRLIAERQETGFAIIRHITHSLNPTIRTALSPLLAVQIYLFEKGMSNYVIARRRDGSDERVCDALDTAVVSLGQIRDILDTTENLFSGRIEEQDFVEVDLHGVFEREILPLFAGARFVIQTDFNGVGAVRLHRASFVQAMKNLISNAEVHGFPDGFIREEGLTVFFTVRQTVKELVIDYANNGIPFPRGFRTGDFLAFGRKGKKSPGKGLGGAWVAKFIELHHGAFRKISNDPVHFRIVLPRRCLK